MMRFKTMKMAKIGRFTILVLGSSGFMFTLAACTQLEKSPSDVRVTQYQCGNGEENVQVTYFINEERAVLVRHGESIALKQKPSGSGFIYSNGPNTIRGKGEDLLLEIGRMVPIECKAQQ